MLAQNPLEGFRGNGSAGLAIPGAGAAYNSVAVYDIDGNPENGLEIIHAGTDGTVSAVSASGEVLWTSSTPTCRSASDSNQTLSSPAVGELFGDGLPYVVIGYGGVATSRGCPGGVIAFNALTGKKRWNFNVKRYDKVERYWAFSNTVVSTPALADVDGNGTLEIGFGSFDRKVYLLDARGKPIFDLVVADTVWSSATFVDTDNDGTLEMVIGTDISRNDKLVPPTKDGGMVYALRTSFTRKYRKAKTRGDQGRFRKTMNFWFRDPEVILWSRYLPQAVYSAPSVGEVLESSSGPEIVVGSGCFFPQSSNDKDGKWVKILSSQTGEVLQTLKTSACTEASPALGDINGDGKNEVVITENGSSSIGGDGSSRVTAWIPESGEVLWSTIPKDAGGNQEWGAHFQSPIIADLDKNGSQEVIVSNQSALVVLEGSTGTHLTCAQKGCNDGLPRLKTGGSNGTPTVADINQDGQNDLLLSSDKGSSGAIYVWTDLEELASTPGTLDSARLDWPTWRGNVARSAILSQ